MLGRGQLPEHGRFARLAARRRRAGVQRLQAADAIEGRVEQARAARQQGDLVGGETTHFSLFAALADQRARLRQCALEVVVPAARRPRLVERGVLRRAGAWRTRRPFLAGLGHRRARRRTPGGAGRGRRQRRAARQRGPRTGLGRGLPALPLRQQPLRVREAGARRVLERPHGLRVLLGWRCRRIEHQLGEHQAGMQAAVVIGALVPLGDGAGVMLGKLKRNMVTDQLPGRWTVLSSRTFKPVERRRQALRESGAAEQIQLAQLELGRHLPGAGVANDRQFFAVSHRWNT